MLTSLRLFVLLPLAACGSSSGVPDARAVDGQPDARDVLDAGETCPDIVGSQFGSDRDDEAGVVVAEDGSIYVFGYEEATLGDATIEPGGSPRGFVEKLGPDGWRWVLSDVDGAIDAAEVQADGSLMLAGRVRAQVPPDHQAQFDLLQLGIGSDGALTALERLGVAPSERPRAIASGGDGWHVVAGYHDLYIPTTYVEAWEDPFFVTWHDAEGPAHARLTVFGSPAPDLVHGVALDPVLDQILLAGTGRAEDARGALVSRYARDGTYVSTHRISLGAGEVASAIRRLPDGDVLVAGTTWRMLGDQAFGGEDVFVARYDATLTTRRWVTQLGSSSSDLAVDLAIDRDGRAWIAGETLGTVGPSVTNAGGSDVFAAALDATGALRWTWQRGSRGDDRVTRIAVGPCETVLVAGATNADIIYDTEAAGDDDAFVLRAH